MLDKYLLWVDTHTRIFRLASRGFIVPNFSFLNRPLFDCGAIQHLAAVLAEMGVKRPLICSDPGLEAVGLMDRIRTAIPNDINYSIYDKVPPNPTQEAVEEALEAYRSNNCDGLIGFGGGSSMDLAKAVGVLVTHEGKIDQYSINNGGVIEDIAPLLAIPTTSGTGSEVSNGAVIIMSDGQKLILASPSLVPRAAICDPELTLGLPPALTAGSGMDAMTHCIEAVLVPMDNPPAEAVGLDGLERGIRNGHLERAVKEGSNVDARWNMMVASTEGAMAFTKGLGPVHSMSHACGAMRELGLHHGTLNGVFLPTILRWNHGHVEDKYQRIARAMGIDENADLAEYIEQLNQRIGLPANLSDMGVTEDMIPFLSEHATNDPCNFTSPRVPTREDYEQLFVQAMA